MKNIMKGKLFAAALTLGTLGLTGCIEETLPLGGAITSSQVEGSAKGLEASLNGPAAIITDVFTTSSNHYDWGYGAAMHVRDIMTADMAVSSSTYNHFSPWSSNSAQGEEYYYAYFLYTYYYKAIQTANEILRPINLETATEDELGYAAVGRAWRALFYLDAARMFEFLPNDGTSNISEEGKDITNLTVPIVTETITEAVARNNPRAPREEMFNFILADLDFAEENIELLPAEVQGDATPGLAVVYGLKARLYMWMDTDESYVKAAEYARKAINFSYGTKDNPMPAAYEPMTREQCLSTSSGFNTVVPSWMLSCQQTAETYAVQTGIICWTSWMSNEAQYGYAAAGPRIMISSNLYGKITEGDFRKLMFKAPVGSLLEGTEPFLDEDFANTYLPEYASLKFRPGSGNAYESKTGNITAFPLMRIEEMYFIEAEAIAHATPARGKILLETFMRNYRNENYTCRARTPEDIIQEIITQKSIEFFGEGQSFFDIKRLNYSVDRTLSSNYTSDERFRTNGRPAWMNICFPYTERINNRGLQGCQNPDPSTAYEVVK